MQLTLLELARINQIITWCWANHKTIAQCSFPFTESGIKTLMDKIQEEMKSVTLGVVLIEGEKPCA